ncbi:MAG TPA: ECF transporter S component [Candidatus Limiplasma sp.]|nr:ECF transporter S component [Candidatus Limiplasma sp.]
MDKASINLRRVTVSALLLSISLVLKTTLSIYIPLFGQNGMSVGISGIFSMMPAFLFGPVYGAIVAGLTDLLGYLLKPAGAYLPLMTLTVAAGGFMRGAFWGLLRNRGSKNMRIAVAAFSAVLLAVGICNVVFLQADGLTGAFYDQAQTGAVNTDNMHLVSKMLITRTINTKDPSGNLATYITFVTAGVIGSAVLGLLLLAADWFLSKKLANSSAVVQLPQLLIVLIVSGLIVTTLNTVILRETIYASWKVLPFAVIWIPRAIEEILGNTVKAYFIALLLGLAGKQRGLRELVNFSFRRQAN